MTRPPQGRTARSRTRRSGFSLLELIAVVTILGIIAAVVIPRISSSSTTARANADAQTTAEVRNAIERFYFDTGAYPNADTLAELNTALVNGDYLHAAATWGTEPTYTKADGKITP